MFVRHELNTTCVKTSTVHLISAICYQKITCRSVSSNLRSCATEQLQWSVGRVQALQYQGIHHEYADAAEEAREVI